MSDREAFVAAVAASPEDDLPRLVFADWLDEHGENERAEFIRVQCELARDPERDDLLEREAALLADPTRLLDPADRDAFAAAEFTLAFTRGFLTGAVFADYHLAGEVADDWHRLCDIAVRNPLFDHVECPGWFALTVAKNRGGWLVTSVEFEQPRRCQECGGDGWLGRAARCPECNGYGTTDTPLEFIDEANPWQTGRIRWQIGRHLFGRDHLLFREQRPR